MTWYSPDDYSIFRTDCKYIIQATKDLDYTHETRGLERYINWSVLTERYEKAAIQVVLIEQKRQRKQGICNPDLIGEMSSVVTRKARILARDLALMDAECAYGEEEECAFRVEEEENDTIDHEQESWQDEWQARPVLIRVESC